MKIARTAKQALRPLRYDTARGQQVILLLYVLAKLEGLRPKEVVYAYIKTQSFYDLTEDDLEACRSTGQARWKVQLAYARKDAHQRRWLQDCRHEWGLSAEGEQQLCKCIEKFRRKEWDVARCYLWTPKFKGIIDPDYTPSEKDSRRPDQATEDLLNLLFASRSQTRMAA